MLIVCKRSLFRIHVMTDGLIPQGAIPGFYIHPSLDLHGRFRVPYPQKTKVKIKQPQQALVNC